MPSIIGPGDTQSIALNPAREFLAGPDIIGINNGAASLVLELKIEYSDTFGEHWANMFGLYRSGIFTVIHPATD
jgi:ABC-type enterobactin transport system permease subunit